MTRRGWASLAAAALAAGGLFWDKLRPAAAPPPEVRLVEPDRLGGALKVLPARNAGRGGRDGDPLNLAFWGTAAEVADALRGAGWTEVPLSVPASVRAGLLELATRQKLARFPPFNIYRLLGRPQDMNWAQVETPIVSRHHFRLWRTGFADREGRELWWGSGNHDLAIRWSDLSHRPDPNMDKERDFIAWSLESSGVRMSWVDLPQIPRSGANDKGYEFKTDGRALLVDCSPARPRTP
ncbi:MAG: LssY C-terminal domain-containing protein [Elusimicrobia bacterium]|nr:LssY C-terminal domain-containing protein [Elusimicrobiota bacterium]